jgi:carboxylate-amine ligase
VSVSLSPAAPVEVLQLGVEEEFLLADRDSRYSAPRAAEVIEDAARELGGRVQSEFFATQLEVRTEPHASSELLLAQLAAGRQAAARAAASAGCLLLASPTAILTRRPLELTDAPRYRAVARHLAATVAQCDAELSGCHIHLGTLTRPDALAMANHLRPWLPAFQAMAANSPFADGRDARCASSRAVRYAAWPTVGPAPLLDQAGYEALADSLVASGTILDRRMIYWYARPSEHVPTLEVRMADVNADVEITLLLAVLLRGLGAVLLAEARRGVPAAPIGDEAVARAHRQAALLGLRGTGTDPDTSAARPLGEILRAAADRARPALEVAGDLPFALDLLERLFAHGNGAARQHATYRKRRSITDVVDSLAIPTSPAQRTLLPRRPPGTVRHPV